MGKLSRDKGARGEREFSRFLSDHGYPARRGCQFSGGPDSPDVVCAALPFHFEVKRAERIRVYEALNQAISEAGPGKIPLVCHRQNGKEWLCILKATDLLKIAHSGPIRTE